MVAIASAKHLIIIDETYWQYSYFLWKVCELLVVEIIVWIEVNWREFLIHFTLRVPA